MKINTFKTYHLFDSKETHTTDLGKIVKITPKEASDKRQKVVFTS